MSRYATVAQIQQVLRHQLCSQWAASELAHRWPPLMIWGPPGVGKSSLVRDLCRELDIGFVDVRLAQREPVDMRGLPVPSGDEVRWLLSSEWPRDPQSRGIILFDELTAADRTLQVSAYEFILDRRLGDLYRVPDGWLICAAGNRSEDLAGAGTFSSALANRFCHVELGADLNTWLRWATRTNIHPEVCAFLRFQPQHFFDQSGNLERGWPTPRSWERVSTLLHEGQALPMHTCNLLINGLVGPAASAAFAAFRRYQRDLPDIPALLRGECSLTMPERADQRYALSSGLAYHLWLGNADEQSLRLAHFLRIGQMMSSDFATMAMLDALQVGSEDEQVAHAEMLFSHPEYAAWSVCHGAFMSHLQADDEGLMASPSEHDNFARTLQEHAAP